MKKYLVIGNPIEHSLSPKLHNFWIKKNNISAIYDREKLTNNDLEDLILKIRKNQISGANVTVPFKKEVISYLDKLSPESENTKSVNTIYVEEEKIIGHNTDIYGFEFAIRNLNFDISNKKALILGAGGVVPSIIVALKNLNVSNIIVSNRTKEKAEHLKILFKNLTLVDWGEIPDFDIVVNATSVGLNEEDYIDLDFSKVKGKFFYDLIYNPKETRFLKTAQNFENRIENGKKMFIYQAAAAFKIWHGINPEINEEVIRLLD